MIHLSNLPLPCPVNQMYRALPIRVRGRTIARQVLSKRARVRRDLVVAAIWQQLGGRPVAMTGMVQATYTITPRDRRTPDVDAYEKHLLDCMAHAGVYLNDKQVAHVSKERLQPSFPGHVDVQVWQVGE
ncbi:RusA family crossover junction endodeoxyribonuclease [Methylibium sp.]|uniref:RusA family crossover junction endodeoxyribonuclease n=1 Tax=Methylibium sp. TaxID=2067992 RepID=UPI0017E43C37|nr:RusA family crossover junction endodeoxyribonuclease [Methylibium sp.]MBA3591752.1 RusA family crossover junction endodeoxyribonuclease [Methylibium sp.]